MVGSEAVKLCKNGFEANGESHSDPAAVELVEWGKRGSVATKLCTNGVEAPGASQLDPAVELVE